MSGWHGSSVMINYIVFMCAMMASMLCVIFAVIGPIEPHASRALICLACAWLAVIDERHCNHEHDVY
jgi:hypothetical protein